MANNPVSFRLPFEAQMSNLPPEHQTILRTVWNAITDLQGASSVHSTNIASLTPKSTSTSSSSTSSSSSSTVTATQAQSIASAAIAAQFPSQLQANLGATNNQTGTSYTIQRSDYGGIVTFDNAAAVAVVLNNGTSTTVNNNFWAALENLGAGTVTLTPASGNVNGVASITLATNQGALVYFDGSNWWALTSVDSSGSGVTSLNALTGALSLTSTGATLTITPSGTSIDLELSTPVSVAHGGTGTATPSLVAGSNVTITGSWPNQTVAATGGGGGLPVNNPTFTGVLTGPTSNIDQLNAHSATPPTVTLHGPAGSGASYTIGGNDSVGQITITAGTGPSTGYLLDINLHTAYTTSAIGAILQCYETITGAGVNYSAQGFQGSSLGQIQVNLVGTAFTAGHSYFINYIIFGY